MMNNMQPDNWKAVAYPSLKPLASWIIDLIARIDFMRKWLHEGQPNVFWLGGFYFPQGFMTGTLQNHARKYKLPIDELNFAFKVRSESDPNDVENPPDDGVYISGLYFDGARWDTEGCTIVDAKPAENWSTMNVVHLIPTMNYKRNKLEYSCPCYKTSTRQGALSTTGMSTNYVLNIDLPCRYENGEPPEFWVLRGAAFVLNLND